MKKINVLHYSLKSICLLLTFVLACNAHGQEESVTVKWDDGISVKGENYKLKFGGRIMYDMAFFGQDTDIENTFGELKSANEFRRIRLYNSGTLYNKVNYKLDVDLTGGEVTAKDMFLELADVGPVGNIRIGHFKQPQGVEKLTSSKYITFLERAASSDLVPLRNTGIMVYNQFMEDRLGLQVAAFRNTDKNGGDTNAGNYWNFTTRASFLPVVNDEKEELLHLGIGYSARNPKDQTNKISTRPEAHLSAKYINTGSIVDVVNMNDVNVEAAYLRKSFSVQGEYVASSLNRSVAENINFSGYYAQASYFVTGEARNYKNSYSAFSKVRPSENLGDNGAGALELALRYSTIDATDQNITGGEMNNWTVGANWHLNPVTRVMANYTLADVNNIGKSNIFQLRFQVSF